MTINDSLQHVPPAPEASRFSRRTLALLPGVLLGGALALGGESTANAAGSDLREMNFYLSYTPSASFDGKMHAGGSVSASLIGLPKGAAVKYQWRLNGASVKGATKSSFAIPRSAVGKKLSLHTVVTAKGYKTDSAEWSLSRVELPAMPTYMGFYSAFGTYIQAQPQLLPKGAKVKYQWRIDGKDVKGATKATFSVPNSAAGKKVSVYFVATAKGYARLAVDYTYGVMPGGSKKKTLKASTPTITGTLRVGSKLTAHKGTWTAGTTRTYQWYANGVAIKGATKYTLVVPSSAKGKQLTVKITGRKSGYTTLSKVSKETSKIAAQR
ncbi:hypothetical protein DEO23_12245 [Brachybacterium endophyticum]|uniref:Uncharacterized protein n=1 Tax=Brachybacterium endophyticum TaxID=2182385 RepID=A0A2U2RHM7_9MICO|nr:hypothetical protein [Brachybacterium endophyticum]PWH05356.1 hypothetical protein DEO23_12245 [Brachybacterium endophyticum]